MIPGFCTTLPPGGHDDFLLDFIVEDSGNGLGAVVTLRPAVNYPMNHCVGADGMPQTVVSLADGLSEPVKVPVAYDTKRSSHSVFSAPLGDWDSQEGIDVAVQERYFTADKAKMVQIDFDTVIETIEAYGDSAQFSAWTLNGLRRYTNGRPFSGRSTEMQIDITLTNPSGTNYTVTLSLNGFVIASGSRTGNGVVTLTAQNNSGVSGSVTLAFSAVIAEGAAYAVARWCASYTVVVNGSSVTVNDPGLSNRLTAQVGPFAAGTYAWSVTGNSDSGVVGSSASGNVTVPGRPAPITNLAYVSGNCGTAPATPATTLSWTASLTGGATYNFYDSELNMPTDFDTVVATHIAGSGTLTQVLPVFPIGVGKRRVCIEAVNGGVESGARIYITLEYDASGNIVLARPNTPTFKPRAVNPVTSGRTLNIDYVYDSTGQTGVCTQIQLFIWAEGVSPTFGAPNATASLPAATNNISRGTITVNTGADGWFNYCVRAATAGGTLSPNTSVKGPIYASNAAPAAPANVETTVNA